MVTDLPSDDWPSGSCASWHLAASELDAGLRQVEVNPPDDSTRVTIAHLDTGYPACRDDPGLPPHLSTELSRDFTPLHTAADSGIGCIVATTACDSSMYAA